MLDWQSSRHLEDHFADHGRDVGARTIEEYDASARATLARSDIIFSYDDPTTGLRRVGCYDRETRLFTVLSDDDRWIISHFATDDGYIRRLMRDRHR